MDVAFPLMCISAYFDSWMLILVASVWWARPLSSPWFLLLLHVKAAPPERKKNRKERNNNRPSLSSVRQFWEHNMVSGLGSSPHRDGGLIKPLTLGQRVKKKHACQLVHLPSKAYGANLIKCIGGRFQKTSTSLMWKIRPGCKNSNQTTVDSLGVIRAKEEPAAASSTASQSPPHAGRLLARPDRQKARPDPFNSSSGFWALRNRRNTRRRENRPKSAKK